MGKREDAPQSPKPPVTAAKPPVMGVRDKVATFVNGLFGREILHVSRDNGGGVPADPGD